ncbi:30S ribosomal protein S8 [Candidatus Kaiserbacteria bacterium CG10_big_fil_rev_8_21_14_0_10_43_70]|uniref:Small ribosomal subunit protein uS8 n=1 Tax=Candidatus Kaiserbacteria bacterium CG10_big_fil_rev_8_21_14_0_10_43_70 TaxID=1974605 RepID=A0A2H0UJH3_9BACT|nr:MAG: 30S ribosomal protein S8 [Candidatus Kaiserbacteria bacterium CG10_big_fil_rev_8_21_14_0_10_43_70]
MITDPIGDFIIRIKNAGAVGKDTVSIPHSKFKMAVADKLREVGYIQSIDRKGKKVKKTIEISLAYDKDGVSRIKGVKRISKPGRRLYRSVDEIHPVRYGHGYVLLSTPNGVMTDKEARKARVGGEALFEIW